MPTPSTTVMCDSEGKVAARYDATAGTAYLIRPDQHVCARWRHWTRDDVEQARARATCNDDQHATAADEARRTGRISDSDR